jgi:polygalacturonase
MLLALSALSPAKARSSYLAPTLPVIPEQTYNVTKYGAVGDGLATNTIAIQSAIKAAAAAGGGTVEVPPGVFLCGPIQLADHIRLHLDAGAVLQMLPLEKYPGGTANPANFIGGSGLHDVAITGSGTIDGQGAPWWPYARQPGAGRPRLIGLSSCDRVLIEQVTLTNSPMFHVAIGGRSSNVTVRKVTIRANPSTDPVLPSHNTDACDVSGSHVLVQDCDISVGDDNFTCGGGTSDVLITNCNYGYGHGVSIGSHTRGGVSNLTVINCTFHDTDCGIRIKSDRDRGGLVQNVSYLNLRMTNVGCPILIFGAYAATDRQYRALQTLTPEIAASYPSRAVTDSTPAYRDITFSNITATAQSGRRAGLIWGLPEMPITNVVMQHVNITADKPLGIYYAQGIGLVDCRIITPAGVNSLSWTNAQITAK